MNDSAVFTFNSENFRNPKLPSGLSILDIKLEDASIESLSTVGARLIDSADELTCEKRNFEIVKWPVSGWRQLDPNTGDEGGTTEGDFEVHWEGDYFFGHNLGISSVNNYYLDGLAKIPEEAVHVPIDVKDEVSDKDGEYIYLWMSDYHPDGAQLFWNHDSIPFVVCLGPSSKGDDIQPSDMRAFRVPSGKGVYFKAGTWHNGVYTHPCFGKQTFLTRQGKVHARVSCSWAAEFKTLLRVPLCR